MIADGARLIIEPVTKAWRLEDVLVGMTPEGMHEAFDWGDDRGREVVDEQGLAEARGKLAALCGMVG